MNEFKGTPGPWDFSWHVQPNGCPTVGHKGLMVCMVAHSAKEPSQKETALADAALISAAPDLLQCQTMGAQINTPDFLEWLSDRLVNVYGEDPNVDFILSLRARASAARAALAKALGEKP